MVSFEVPGPPHAKRRPRFGKGFTYTDKATVNAEAFIRLLASEHFPEPMAGAVSLDVTAVFAPPKSWSTRKTQQALGQPHQQRPDLDNIFKSVADGLNGVAYADDSQITEFSCRKVWGEVAKTIVRIAEVSR